MSAVLGWVVAGLISVIGAVVWYRSRSTQVNDLLTQNKAVLSNVNSLLLALVAKANAANTQDQKEAKNVSTAKEASAFLNASGSNPGLPAKSPGTGTTSQVRFARRATPSKPIYGFVRDRGHDSGEAGLRPGSVLEGRAEMARGCVDLP